MSSVNRCQLIGHIGKDPVVNQLKSGTTIVNISVATTDKWNDKQGNKQEKTEWHRVVFFQKLAEIAEKYLRRGSLVYIEGSLSTRKYTDKQGIEKYTTEIVASQMQMLGGKSERSIEESTKESTSKSYDEFDEGIPF